MNYDRHDKVRRREAKSQFGSAELRRFQLTAALAAGGNAAAKVLVWDTTQNKYVTGNETFTVYSVNQAAGASGSQGVARFAPDRHVNGAGVWEVVEGLSAPPAVRIVTFLLPQALDGTLVSFSAPVLTDWYGNAGGANVTVINELGWVSDAGSKGYAIYRPSDGLWPIIVVPCASETS